MRNIAFLLLLISLASATFAQDQQSNFKKDSKTETNKKSGVNDEQGEFQKAITEKDAATRISYLQKFVVDFPASLEKQRALGLIVSGRAELADSKLKENEIEAGVKLFKLAVKEAPTPVPDRLYGGIILQIPNNLFFYGQRVAGLEVAALIEEKVADNPNQLLALSNFYLGVENAPAALRVAENVIALDPETKGVYQVLGLARRFNFDLERSAEAYARALELNPESVTTKNSLAEMKRATGKHGEAITLYKEILTVDAANIGARTGLILSLFDSGKITDAETSMSQFLVEEPNNLFLLVGAAYWYAANGNGQKAIKLASDALTIEPRYTWGYIALARGLMINGDPVGAEKVLLNARKFGNFPTLQYEIALARLAAGFYRDAADELKQSFVLENGVIKTNLGGKFVTEADNFTDLLALERRAGIFQTLSADKLEEAEGLKKLLKFFQTINAAEPIETEIVESADEFIKGDDKMKTHRQIFVADQLLEKKVAFPKVLEITKDATKGVDKALDSTNPSAAVLANELYDARRQAMSKGEVLIIPELPRQTLSDILRGRIEEISGWALFRQKNNAEAAVRLKRAISVLPKDSVWMRSTMWRMGTILETDGKTEDALNYYIKGYSIDENDEVKKTVIESLYKKINGNLDGLKERLEAKPQDNNTSAIFINNGKTSIKKTESKVENPRVEKKENPPVIVANTKKIPDVVPIKKESNTPIVTATPNIDKFPEDINLNVLNDAKTPPIRLPAEKIINQNPEIKKDVDENLPTIDESKVDTTTDEINLDDPDDELNETLGDNMPAEELKSVETDKVSSEAIEELKSVETDKVSNEEPNDATPAKLKKPLVIINDNFLNIKTEIDPNKTTESKNQIATPPSEELLINEKEKTPVDLDNFETKKTELETVYEEPKKTEIETVTDETARSDVKTENPIDATDLETKKTEIDPGLVENAEINKTIENLTGTDTEKETIPTVENDATIDTIDGEKQFEASVGLTRPRIVPIEDIKKADEPIPTCGILVSQDEITILNNGGNLGIIVGVEKESLNSEIKAISSSPEDVEAIFEPKIGASQGRAFFYIRSISTNTGDFKLTFDTPCGKKEIPVIVR